MSMLMQQQPSPIFTSEGPQYYAQAYAQNSPYATQGSYTTSLPPKDESSFRKWVKDKDVPFDPDAKTSDYDMRGYYQAMRAGKAPEWKGEGSHFPDTYKTPYDTTFSAESKYATPANPFVWQGDNLVNKATGQLIFAAPSGNMGMK